jgi:hypothetical protein
MSLQPEIDLSQWDHDLNNHWGLVLGADVPSHKPKSNAYWAEFHADRVRLERQGEKILADYTDMFEYMHLRIRDNKVQTPCIERC